MSSSAFLEWGRRRRVRLAVAGALAGVMAASVVAIAHRGGGSPVPAASLVAAVRSTSDAGGARVRASGTLRATIELRSSPVPAQGAMPFRLDQLPEALRDGFARSFAEAGRQFLGAMLPPMEIRLRMDGDGEIVFPDRLHLRGEMTSESPVPVPVGGPFELIVVGRDAWIKMPLTGGKWARIPAASSPFRLTFSPGAILDAMKAARGGVADLGRETMDGVQVRHFRIAGSGAGPQPAPDGAAGSGSFAADVWIGERDGILRSAQVSSDGRISAPVISMSISATGRIHLFDFGAAVSVTPPPAGDVTDGSSLFPGVGGGSSVAPGGFGFSFGFSASSSTPPPAWMPFPFPSVPPPTPGVRAHD